MKTLTKAPQPKDGPIMDFCRAVEEEFGNIKIGEIYSCKRSFFRFYEAAGKQIGLDVFKPCGGKSGFVRGTRVQPDNKRRDLGIFENPNVMPKNQ